MHLAPGRPLPDPSDPPTLVVLQAGSRDELVAAREALADLPDGPLPLLVLHPDPEHLDVFADDDRWTLAFAVLDRRARRQLRRLALITRRWQP